MDGKGGNDFGEDFVELCGKTGGKDSKDNDSGPDQYFYWWIGKCGKDVLARTRQLGLIRVSHDLRIRQNPRLFNVSLD